MHFGPPHSLRVHPDQTSAAWWPLVLVPSYKDRAPRAARHASGETPSRGQTPVPRSRLCVMTDAPRSAGGSIPDGQKRASGKLLLISRLGASDLRECSAIRWINAG